MELESKRRSGEENLLMDAGDGSRGLARLVCELRAQAQHGVDEMSSGVQVVEVLREEEIGLDDEPLLCGTFLVWPTRYSTNRLSSINYGSCEVEVPLR